MRLWTRLPFSWLDQGAYRWPTGWRWLVVVGHGSWSWMILRWDIKCSVQNRVIELRMVWVFFCSCVGLLSAGGSPARPGESPTSPRRPNSRWRGLARWQARRACCAQAGWSSFLARLRVQTRTSFVVPPQRTRACLPSGDRGLVALDVDGVVEDVELEKLGMKKIEIRRLRALAPANAVQPSPHSLGFAGFE